MKVMKYAVTVIERQRQRQRERENSGSYIGVRT